MRLLPESAMNKLPLASISTSVGLLRCDSESEASPEDDPATVTPRLFQVAFAAQRRPLHAIY